MNGSIDRRAEELITELALTHAFENMYEKIKVYDVYVCVYCFSFLFFKLLFLGFVGSAFS